jgi:hypothetical protein
MYKSACGKFARMIGCLFIVCGISFSVARQSTAAGSQQGSAAGSAQPADAQKVRAEIRGVENVLPRVPDRGAALFLLARRYAHLTGFFVVVILDNSQHHGFAGSAAYFPK